jgi:hypothetical protein
MIDILIPVLGRPHRAAPLVQNIRDTTTVPHAITFICSPEDKEQIAAVTDLRTDYVCMDETAGPGDYAKKINVGFQREGRQDCEWIFQAADDLTFTPGWAEAALKMADSGPGYDVVATNDMANASVKRGLFGTHNLIRRRYVTANGGEVLHEGYDHNFVDREMCGWAQSRGVYTFARHSHVKHHHPLFDRTVVKDDTYLKSLANFFADQKLFYSRAHMWGYHGLSAHERKMAA